MHKTVSSVLLGMSLLSACSKSRDVNAIPTSIDRVTDSAPRLRGVVAEQKPPATRVAADPSTVEATPANAPRDQPDSGAAAGSGVGYASVDKPKKLAEGRGSTEASSGEDYHDWGKNPWVDASKDHLSTFAADVDTASYTIARRKLTEGSLPPPASVRVEEFVNYFHYAFPAPSGDTPFAVVMDAAPSPVSPGRHILRVGVATRTLSQSERKPAHLVFLVDVSGSMSSPDKLDLAKQALHVLTNHLKDGDTVSLVTYAGDSRVVLPPTGISRRGAILSAIDELRTGGSTAMGSGIDLAYQQAMKGLTPDAVARVIVCTDGDANVGSHTHDEILKIIAGRAKEGVTLSTIGFGMGNYKDALMEQLADKGNGNNYYIDSLAAANKLFGEQLGAMLEVVAKDVKLQVDFDPSLVARYRLVGYENRDIKDDDFRNDKVDAGEVGGGHQVTALYEIELTDKGRLTNAPLGGVRIRHKQPRGTQATERAFPMISGAVASFANAPADLRFAFAVAAFADILRNGQDAEHWSLAKVRDLASAAAGDDDDRKELVALINRAIALRVPTRQIAR
jgi:Ca-activated chloride channel family protein